MNAWDYVNAMYAASLEPDPDKSRTMWRKAKSDRQRYLNEQRRLRDPDWWDAYLERNARYRREHRRKLSNG